MKLIIVVLALLFLIAPISTFANHGGGRSGGNHSGNTHSNIRPAGRSGPAAGERGRIDNRSFNRGNFGRSHSNRFGQRDGRWIGGRHEFFFGGVWFYPYYGGIWPAWFYNCDVYFDLGPDGLYYAYCAADPTLSIQVAF